MTLRHRFVCLLTLLFLSLPMAALAAIPASPSALKATALAYNKVALSWVDNSTDETGFQLEYKSTGTWTVVNFVEPANATTEMLMLPGFTAGVTYTFRISSFNATGAGGARLYSATYSTSNALTMPSTASTFEEATGLTAVFTGTAAATSVILSWTDNANTETGYEVYAKQSTSSQYQFIKTATGNTTSITGLPAATSLDFIVRAYRDILAADGVHTDTFHVTENIANYPLASIEGVYVNSKPGASSIFGSAFSHTFTITQTARVVTTRTITALPSSLAFNSSTGALTGTFPPVGIYPLSFTVNFVGGSSQSQVFYIRVRPPEGAPVVGTAIPAWSANLGATRDSSLAGTFTDAEAESAVRISTTVGDINVVLFDNATPATVANFKNYLARYPGAAFHRSIASFVIQGGGFKPTGTGSNFTTVTTDAPVVNEPGIPNALGTICMAKLGGDPNSATDQFFISVADNTGTYPNGLDYQNGGFSVFGRVAGAGMTVATAISNKPTATYNLFLDGGASATSFANFPMNAATAPATFDPSLAIKINSATLIPTLSYAVTGNTNPAVVTPSIVSGQLHLVALTYGTSNVTVTATDLDNKTATQTIAVTINNDTYTTWAARQTFTGGLSGSAQNPDNDPLNNLLEFAFLGNPSVNSQTEAPTLGATATAPAAMTLTFPVRKNTTGLTYEVQTSPSLTGTWNTLWSSADGFAHARVQSAVDQADRTLVTIKDSVDLGTGGTRFLRAKVTQL